jgi:amidophosphoribosyltransferase
MFPCPYLLATRTKKELAARRVIKQLTGEKQHSVKDYLDCNSLQYRTMIMTIQKELGVTSLKYQAIDDMVQAIGLPREKLCLYCWDGKE